MAASVVDLVVLGFLKSAPAAPSAASSPGGDDSSSSEMLNGLGNILLWWASSNTSSGNGRSFVASLFVVQLRGIDLLLLFCRLRQSYSLDYLSRHGHFGAVHIAHLAASDAPLDSIRNTLEILWTGAQKALHAG